MTKQDKRKAMITEIIEGIMAQKIGNLEYIIMDYVGYAGEDVLEKWSKELGISYIGD